MSLGCHGGAQEQGPDDEENDALPDNVIKTCFNASPVQMAFDVEASGDGGGGGGGG